MARRTDPKVKTFMFDDRVLPLLDHPYNATATNERAVEVPIVLDWISRQEGEHGIEIGNVLSHYGPTSHVVVDRYEHTPGVRNQDVFTVDSGYDWLVAISTLEHVRQDEQPYNNFGGLAALMFVMGLARHVLVTIPFGQNPTLDAALPCLDGWKAGTMVRRRRPDRWYQSPKVERRDRDDRGTVSVWIGEWENR